MHSPFIQSQAEEEKYVQGTQKVCIDSNVFCYICGRFTTPKERWKITDFIQKVYHAYFGVKLGDQDNPWTSHRVCDQQGKNISLWGFLWYGESQKIILMIATSAVPTFQEWYQRLDLPHNIRISHLLYSPSLILMSNLFQYLKPARFLTAKLISFQLRILKTSMKNLMLEEDLAEFLNSLHRLIWMTWWGILIYGKIQLN